MRHSKQREAILALMKADRRHQTADEIHRMARELLPNLSLGTVYRDLGQLAAAGEIMRIDLPGEPSRFDATTEEHHHLLCKTCGKVYDVFIGGIPASIRKAAEAQGCILDGWSIAFSGVCQDCAECAKRFFKNKLN